MSLLVAALGVAATSLAATGGGGAGGGGAAGSTPVRAGIVSVAESQVGYRTSPAGTYCNRYSAYWDAGTGNCGPGLRSEEWCADFAAWVWRQAGAPLTYALASGDLNAAAASFYVWAEDHGTWHPAGEGYQPRPGDVAVYGLDPADDVATHVAVVTGYTPGQRGPDVVNGDGDHTGFSVVETGTDQYRADASGRESKSVLSGYASPIVPGTAAASGARTRAA
ncbi:MAG: CHAP domain-containing protein [Acidimicrobiales bacterium]